MITKFVLSLTENKVVIFISFEVNKKVFHQEMTKKINIVWEVFHYHVPTKRKASLIDISRAFYVRPHVI